MTMKLVMLVVAAVLAGCGQAPGGPAAAGAGDEPVDGGPGGATDGTGAGSGQGVAGSRGSGQILCKGPHRPAPDAPAGTDCSVPDERIRGRPTRPRPGMVDVHPVPWQTSRASGRRLTVSWWSGVEPCAVLDHVEVVEKPRRVVVTLYEGRDPAAGEGTVCIEIAEARSTTVRLDQPLGDRKVVDGAMGR